MKMEAVSKTGFAIPSWAGIRPVGRIVRGYSMGAIRDGWIVVYDDQQRPMRPELIDELCVVQLADGRCLIRFVREGRRSGCCDLLTESGPAILDAEVIWAEAVTAIIPYRPTAEDLLLPGLEGMPSEVGRSMA
ncbi:UNVERIFIED_ORG: hypothetical protein LHK14_18125 [Roseateles sp. XES5]|nr:hypothetical protein [Roseateles sp. XES5]